MSDQSTSLILIKILKCMWNSLTGYDRLCYIIITCLTNIIMQILEVDILGVDILGRTRIPQYQVYTSQLATIMHQLDAH